MTEAQRRKFGNEIASIWFTEVEEFSMADQMAILASVAAHCARMAAAKGKKKVDPQIAVVVAARQLMDAMNKQIQHPML